MQVRRALLSVSDKRGIVEFARGLAALGVELVSTGGTARELTAAGLEVRAVENLTGSPEIMDGRVKTLSAKLYAGVLAVRDNAEHLQQVVEHDVEFVDLICVNLYPFERTAAPRECKRRRRDREHRRRRTDDDPGGGQELCLRRRRRAAPKLRRAPSASVGRVIRAACRPRPAP